MRKIVSSSFVIVCIYLLQACGGSSGDEPVSSATEEDNTQESESETDVTVTACNPELPTNTTSVEGYHQLSLCGWQVFMSDDLYADVLAPRVFSDLASDIEKVEEVLPQQAYTYLQNTNIWLEKNIEQFPGGVYHPSANWLADNGYPVKWANGIQFGNAQNYLNWKQQQPAMLLHELSHALHDQFYLFNQPDIEAAYQQAMDSGIYDSVEYVDGGIQVAYATTNTTEYFAELTEAYYWVNDFYPFNRSDLTSFDPTGLAAVELLWNMR